VAPRRVMNGSADSYQFATHDLDPQMNLVNANGRIYDPTSAAFLTPDPVRMPTQMGMNLYDYAAADLVNMYDPTGFYPQDDGDRSVGAGSTPTPSPAPSQSPPPHRRAKI
jgi:RHS repeat-associated protein